MVSEENEHFSRYTETVDLEKRVQKETLALTHQEGYSVVFGLFCHSKRSMASCLFEEQDQSESSKDLHKPTPVYLFKPVSQSSLAGMVYSNPT